MAFEKIETEPKPSPGSVASISYERMQTKKGRTKRPKLILSIPTRLCANFKPKDDTLFALHIGTNADAGKARVMPASTGIKPNFLKWSVRMNFGYVPMLGDSAAAKEFITVRALKDAFEVDLPAWFKAE